MARSVRRSGKSGRLVRVHGYPLAGRVHGRTRRVRQQQSPVGVARGVHRSLRDGSHDEAKARVRINQQVWSIVGVGPDCLLRSTFDFVARFQEQTLPRGRR